ncbi:MAG: glutathione S-transferase [Candidatus Poseidonia sp.]|nr:glutathione S-transferase [Poseidonia sp.]
MHEVVYFDSPGFAEVSRFCLELSGLEWKNTVVNWDGYLQLKETGELPWGLLPIIRSPKGIIAESNALLRYTGALAGIEPTDIYMRAKVDELVEVINGWRGHFTPTFAIDDLDDKIAARQAMFADGGSMNKALKAISSVFENSTTGWLAGTESMTIADVKAFMDTFMMFSGQFDGITADMLANYPSLLAFHEKMSNEPRVKAYYSNADEKRWVFRPGAFESISTPQHI